MTVNPYMPLPRLTPLSQITPFTHADGLTYLKVLESLRQAMENVADTQIIQDTAMQTILTEVNSLVDSLTENVKAAIDNVTGTGDHYSGIIIEKHNALMALAAEMEPLIETANRLDAEILTRQQENEALANLVDEEVAGVKAELRPTTSAAFNGVMADGGEPKVITEHNILQDDNNRLVDGAKFMTVVESTHVPGANLDRWYGYVSGHDSTAIWLVTAPSLVGPWTWRHAVIGLPTSGAMVGDPMYTNHTSSPHALVVNGRIHLYYHGPRASNFLEQPTSVATSNDGVNFSVRGICIDTEFSNAGSPYKTSTSYARLFNDRGLIHAVWQGTTGKSAMIPNGGSLDNGYSYGPVPVGHAVSQDGLKFTKFSPIIPSSTGDQGLFAPAIHRFGHMWMVTGTYRRHDGGTSQILSVGCWTGDRLDRLRRLPDIILPGVNRYQIMQSPQFVTEDGKVYMIGGSRLQSNSTPFISLCEMEMA